MAFIPVFLLTQKHNFMPPNTIAHLFVSENSTCCTAVWLSRNAAAHVDANLPNNAWFASLRTNSVTQRDAPHRTAIPSARRQHLRKKIQHALIACGTLAALTTFFARFFAVLSVASRTDGHHALGASWLQPSSF